MTLDGERVTLNFECPKCKSRWEAEAESSAGALFLIDDDADYCDSCDDVEGVEI